MGIKEELIELASKIEEPVKAPEYDAATAPWQVGKSYLFRLVTHAWTGRIIWVGDKEISIETAAWVADTGRFTSCQTDMMNDSDSEIEPVKRNVVIGRGAIVDAIEWLSELPTEPK